MRDGRRSERVPFITTSWDDGHPLDLRLAAMLAGRGVRRTFYVTCEPVNFPVMTGGQMRSLRRMGMEVGSHTVTHAVLTHLDHRQALEELRTSKMRLEDRLGDPVTSFCYPKGEFNRRVRGWAAEAGYRSARTTVAFRTETTFHPFAMPVSLQLFPHAPQVHFRHALKEANLPGLANWGLHWSGKTDLEGLAARMLDYILKNGGVLHLWGHSWEIERHGLWGTVERVLDVISGHAKVSYLTNGQVVEQLSRPIVS